MATIPLEALIAIIPEEHREALLDFFGNQIVHYEVLGELDDSNAATAEEFVRYHGGDATKHRAVVRHQYGQRKAEKKGGDPY